MPDHPDLVQLALLIRRGQLRLADVPEAHRRAVGEIMYSLTDAQCGTLAFAQEKRRRSFRTHVFQKASS